MSDLEIVRFRPEPSQYAWTAVEAPLANVCDINYTSVAKMAKRYLGNPAAMDGAPARLRELAAEYRR